MLSWSARMVWRRIRGVPTNMASPILSANESRILRVLGSNRESSLPDLAVSAKLAPSVVKHILERLSAKDLIQVAGNFVGLTSKGVISRNLLTHLQAVTSLDDDDATADEQAANAALAEEVSKLER